MMDAKSLVPTGWHFVAPFCEPDGMTRITPLDRKRHPVRYYFIGFGNSLHIPRHQRTPIKGIGGGDCDVPELHTGQAYDPFKLDIYTLGNLIDKYLHEVRILHSLSFFSKNKIPFTKIDAPSCFPFLFLFSFFFDAQFYTEIREYRIS